MTKQLHAYSRLLGSLFGYLLLSNSWFCIAQNSLPPSKLKYSKITVNTAETTIKTTIRNKPSKFKAKPNSSYLWYYAQNLIETNGGYDGKLVHGKYKSFYLNNQLREEGEYFNGVKSGVWRYWYMDGKLREIITWKKGIKNGYYAFYNDFGAIMASGNFKNDQLHGCFFTYGVGGKILEKKKYKKGVEQRKNMPLQNKKEEQQKESASS